ncbi:hypothetical protein ACFX1W_022298 [Malus domestica]
MALVLSVCFSWINDASSFDTLSWWRSMFRSTLNRCLSRSCTNRALLFHGRPRNPPQPLSHHLHPPGSSLPSPHLLPPTASRPSCPLQGSK